MSTVPLKSVQSGPPVSLPVGVAEYLGPGDVLEVAGAVVTARLADGRAVKATMALSVPYEASVGDVLLVIGRGPAHWVIGVLKGHGQTTLRLPGDVSIHADGGTLRLSGEKGVRLDGPEVAIETRKLSLVATALVEHLGSALRRVAGLLSVQAKRSHTVVDEASYEQSKSHAIVAEETVTVNGRQIHLG